MLADSSIKERLFNHCLSYIESRISTAQKAMEAAQEAANEESKSSAGDKYETTRALMQMERDKNAVQLAEAFKLKNMLTQLRYNSPFKTVEAGTLVITNLGNYFLSISVGKISVEDKEYFAIAPMAPLGQILLYKKEGDTFTFNNKNFKIEKII
jgi:hypothetical protein